MTIEEIGEEELLRRMRGEGRLEAVLFYTPLCGTCKLAERMVALARAAGADVPVSKIDIHFAPMLRDGWRIASVPCLVLARQGEPVERAYALSVDTAYRLLKRP